MAETAKEQGKNSREPVDGNQAGTAHSLGARWLRSAYRRFIRLPRNLRLASLALLLFVVGAVLFTRLFSNPAKVTIVCQHGFRTAELSVWVDGDLTYSGTVNGSSRARLGFLGSRPAGLYKTIDVPAGRHSIRVRLEADNEAYDQTKLVSANFGEGGDNSLSVSAGRHGLSVVAKGTPDATDDSGIVSSSRRLASSVMLSIFGSGMSAAIAFLVQEFMRAQKQRLVSPPTEIKG